MVVEGDTAWWIEHRAEVRETSRTVTESGVVQTSTELVRDDYELCRLRTSASAPERIVLDAKIVALAVCDAQVFVITDDGGRALRRVTEDGALETVSTRPVPHHRELVVGREAAFVLEGPSFGSEGRRSSRIHRIDLETGTSTVLAQESFAELSNLVLAGGHLWWQEGQGSAQKANAAIFGKGQSVPVEGASICWVAV